MSNYLLGFPNKKERDDFFIAIVVILFFISLFWYFLGRGDGPKLDMVPAVEVVEENLDADNDGILDSQDRCPDLKGSKVNHGCPADTDGDGVYDINDKCPKLAGIVAFAGCPADTDGDGVYDKDDKCPNRKGKPEDNGCPISKKETELLIDIQKSVEFVTAKTALTGPSKVKLNELIGLMDKYPSLNISIEGHTDSDGNAGANLDLSIARALTCKNYLLQRGVKESRLRHNGFGETRPIAPNTTPQGKRRNRRVEFNRF